MSQLLLTCLTSSPGLLCFTRGPPCWFSWTHQVHSLLRAFCTDHSPFLELSSHILILSLPLSLSSNVTLPICKWHPPWPPSYESNSPSAISVLLICFIFLQRWYHSLIPSVLCLLSVSSARMFASWGQRFFSGFVCLFFFLSVFHCLEYCLEHSTTSRNIHWINDWMIN